MGSQTNDTPDGLKMTELGLLPEDWEVECLGSVATTRKVAVDPQAYPDESFEYYSIPAYQISSSPIVENGRNIHSQKLVVSAGTVLFGKLNPRVPKVWLVEPLSDKRKIASSEFIPLTPVDELVMSAFLYYLVWSDHVMPRAKELVSGSTPSRQRVDAAAFARITVPLPTLSEQKAIAEVLSTVEQAIEAQDKVIAAARETKKSLMRHLFKYGPVPLAEAEKVPLKETEIGPVPGHWTLLKLGQIATARGGTGFPPMYQGQLRGDYPFYKVSDMNLVGNERFMRRANNFVDNTVVSLLRAKPLPQDTMIFPKVGAAVHTNKKRFLRRDALVDNNVMGVSVFDKEKCIPEYLFCWFESIDISEFSNPGPLPSINAHSVKDRMIPLPSLDEQQEIAHILSSLDFKIEAEAKRKTSLEALFKTMLHNLMTGKVRVKDMEGIKA